MLNFFLVMSQRIKYKIINVINLCALIDMEFSAFVCEFKINTDPLVDFNLFIGIAMSVKKLSLLIYVYSLKHSLIILSVHLKETVILL